MTRHPGLRGSALSSPWLLAALICAWMSSDSARAQLPSAPGFDVTVYANVMEPIRLSFDSATGDLYAGRDLSDPRAPTKIHRIGPGGSPVVAYGANQIADPDIVLFDAAGSISGTPGSVLVGGLNAGPPDAGSIHKIAPNEDLSVLFGPTSAYLNPTDMTFDNNGRLLFVDAGIDASQPRALYASTGGPPSALIVYPVGLRPVAVAVDSNNRIFSTSLGDDFVQIHDATGALVDATFASGLPAALLAFGTGGAFGTDLYAIANGELVRVDDFGNKTVVGTGFGNATGIAFGPDEALYVSEKASNRILRIAGSSTGPGSVPTTSLRMAKGPMPGQVTVTWFPSCSPGAGDYAVHEGTLGSWYSHAEISNCTDLNADFSEVVNPAAGGTYYLVVPHNGATEGSYGTDSANQQRPRGALNCAPSQLVGCP